MIAQVRKLPEAQLRRLQAALAAAGATALFLSGASAAQEPIPCGLESITASSDCFMCHGNPTLTKKLPSGHKVSLYINQKEWKKSAHAKMGCQACHGEKPHPPADQVSTFPDWRKYETEMRETCGGCHPNERAAFSTSIHATSTNPAAPSTCIACHPPHEAGLTVATRLDTVEVCGRCHEHEKQTYFFSVHGQNLLLGNPKVAVCFNCHGYHDVHPVADGRIKGVKLSKVCSKCHEGVTERQVTGWYSHTPITQAQDIILNATRFFYYLVIPFTIASMIAHQILKHRRTMARRRAARRRTQ